MTGRSNSSSDRFSRRSVLTASSAALAGSLSGCLGQVQSLVRSSDDYVGLRILTVPADNDRQAIQIARQLEANLEAVGVNVSLEMRSQTEFLRAILLDHEFDIFVGTYPTRGDPDVLYEMLHSKYADEEGWQNPYGFTSNIVDRLLERQRQAIGSDRQDIVANREYNLLREVLQEMPFIPICVPRSSQVVDPDRLDEWETLQSGVDPRSRTAYLDPADESELPAELVSIITDSRPTRNLNPFSAEHRGHGTFVSLLYDSLVTETGDLFEDVTETDTELTPWLAESVHWDGQTATITLREDCQFHDGESVTADDVAFTYEFLADTSLGRSVSPLQATNYRRHVSSVESVTVEDDRTVLVSVETGLEVGERALTVPILPEHVWTAELEELDDDAFPSRQSRWSLLGDDEEELVIGSGLFEYEDSTDRDELDLQRFDDHFTRRQDNDLPATPFEEITFLNDPGSASAVQQVAGGVADLTTSRLETHVLDDARNNDEIELIEPQPRAFYQIGFNDRRNSPTSNFRFRHDVARLIDRDWVTDTIFSGYADPITTPVADEWMPDDLEWGGEAPVAPFCGSNGRLDLERAAEELSGFHTDEDGQWYTNY